MAVGYVTHAAESRRRAIGLFAAYIASFEAMAAFVLALPLLFYDTDHTILSNPVGYFARYTIPVALLGALIFATIYRGHSRAIARTLGVRIVTRKDEPRFIALAEEACTTLGVRLPVFGIIDQPQPNAVTVGEGPVRGMIAVTRGLLDQLDDDELLAVLAHEASHIRQGDTRVLAANYALMRTAVYFQTHNPLRIEDWRQLVIPLFLPLMLPIMLTSSAVTMLAMTIARTARRGIKLSRDHVADGEAVRVTHYPEALLSALKKIGGQGAFPESWRAEDLLFDGRVDVEGGRHPAVADRIEAISRLGRDLMSATRQRRDTRVPARSTFGRSGVVQPASAYRYDGKPLVQPPQTLGHFLGMLGNRNALREWQAASVSWHEWRASDGRNGLGLTPRMIVPVLALSVFLVAFHWPADGNWTKFWRMFSPATVVEVTHMMELGPRCEGAGCNGNGVFSTSVAVPSPSETITPATIGRPQRDQGPPSTNIVWMWGLALIAVVLFKAKPQWARKIGSSVTRLADLSQFEPTPAADEPRPSVAPPHRATTTHHSTGFGRKTV